MTNQDLYNFKPFPLCDGHTHITQPKTVDETVAAMTNIMKLMDYERIVMLGLQQDSKGTGDPGNNLKALYCKSVMNALDPTKRVYAYSCRYHMYNELDTADGYLRQVEYIYKMGFDGIKILDGKPKMRKRLNRRLDDEIFDKFYAFAEEHNMPVTIHLGDPPEFWDINKISEYALKVGWYCDETFPKLEDMREEVLGILKKFPKLRITCAHFFFLSQDLEQCVDIFEKYPTLSFDLTPGGEMFEGFSKRPDDWREFFIKYADKISLGTDTYNIDLSLEDLQKNPGSQRLNLVRRCLETSQPFEHNVYGTLYPLALDDRTLMKIYHDNTIARLGEPKRINAEVALEYLPEMRDLLAKRLLCDPSEERNELEMKNFETMKKYFASIK